MTRSNSCRIALMTLAIGAAFAAPGFGQDATKHAVTAAAKILVDNPRVLAGEATWTPGPQNSNLARPARVLRALAGGTLTVVYADGRTEKRTFETGGVYYFEQDTMASHLRNDGTSEVKIDFVFLA